MKRSVLFFYSSRPTDSDRRIAAEFGAKLRDVNAYCPGESLELCDGVMGLAPREYVEAFGRIDAPAKTPGRAYCVHSGGGAWKIVQADGTELPGSFGRRQAYAKTRELNGEPSNDVDR